MAVKKKTKKLILNISVLVLSIVMLVAGTGMLYVDNLLGRIQYVEDLSSVAGTSSVVSETSEQTEILGEPVILDGLYHDDAILNILVMGVDDYQEGDVGRTDSMMLVSLDTRHQKLKLTSFMRDMYVRIPGSSADRINTAYSVGGPSLTVQTIENSFGVDIDRFVVVKDEYFNTIINRLGGVEIEITDEEAELINRYSYSYSDPVTGGLQQLDGAQAHYYSRIRDIGSDFGRTERQRKVMESLIHKFQTADIGTLNGILYDILPMITTNMQKNEILEVAANALTYLNYEVEQARVPADGMYQDETILLYGLPAMILAPDLQANSDYLIDFIYEEDRPQNS